MKMLQELVKDKGAVIFAYPKANTTGCTKQATGFRDNYADIDKAGATHSTTSCCSPKGRHAARVLLARSARNVFLAGSAGAVS
jgi:peroxiredoxin